MIHFSLRDEVVEFIDTYRQENRRGPTLREIAHAVGMTHQYMREIFDDLRDQGLIEWQEIDGRMVARSVRIAGED